MRASSKLRLDQLLVERELVASRELAQALILRGDVLVDDIPVEKAGAKVATDVAVRIRGELPRYVSRGGDKLEGALNEFSLCVEGKVALDLGASTGGFTDCLLQHGAALVYAVDVGTNQLADRLRRDLRVRVHERTHARELETISFVPRPTLAVVDVSFIGLRKVLPYVTAVLAKPLEIVCLVKPQFELGPELVEKGGVVREVEQQLEAVRLVEEECRRLGLEIVAHAAAVLRGGKKGNQEYFVYARAAASA